MCNCAQNDVSTHEWFFSDMHMGASQRMLYLLVYILENDRMYRKRSTHSNHAWTRMFI